MYRLNAAPNNNSLKRVGEGLITTLPAPKPHQCKPPGWFSRLWNRIKPGTIWTCAHCYKSHCLEEKFGPSGAIWNRWELISIIDDNIDLELKAAIEAKVESERDNYGAPMLP